MKTKRISFLLAICLFITCFSNITLANEADWNSGAKINFVPYIGQTMYKTSNWFESNTQRLGLEAYEDLSTNASRWNVFAGMLRTYQAYLKDNGYSQLSANGATLSNFADASTLEPNAQNEAKILVGLGMLSGISEDDKLYMNMSRDITRGEVAKILATFYQKLNPIQEQRMYSGFNDVSGHWAEEYVRYCYERNLLNGRGDGFAPDDNITKEEAIQILLNMEEKSSNGISLSNIAKALNETYCIVSLYYDSNSSSTVSPNADIPITSTNYSYTVSPNNTIQVTLKYASKRKIEVTAGNDNIKVTGLNSSAGTTKVTVKGIYAGDSYIRCRYQDAPYYEDLCIPIFVKPQYLKDPVASIDVNETSISLNAGAVYYLSNNINVYYQNSTSMYNTHNVYYASTDPKVAIVDFYTGVINARSRGNCYIYILVNGATKRVKVNVSGTSSSGYPNLTYPENGYYSDFRLTETYGQLYKGDTLNLKNKVYNKTGSTLRFSSTNTSVATVTTTGIVSAKSAGYTTIIVTCGSKRLEYQLQVINNDVNITQIYLVDGESTTIGVGEVYDLDYNVEVYPYFADKSQLRYKSSNTSVAKVNSRTGEITGVSNGRATITIYSDYANCYFYVNVDEKKIKVSSIQISVPYIELEVNNTFDLSKNVEVLPQNATNKDLFYTSEDMNIAFVSAATGIIRGVSPGETNVTVMADGVKKSVKVTVKENNSQTQTPEPTVPPTPTQTPEPTVPPTPTQTPTPTVPPTENFDTSLSFVVNMTIQIKEGQEFNPYSVLAGNIDGVTFTFSKTGYAKMENGRVIGVTKSGEVFYLIAKNRYGKEAKLPMKVI